MKTWSVKIATRLDFMTPKDPKVMPSDQKRKGEEWKKEDIIRERIKKKTDIALNLYTRVKFSLIIYGFRKSRHIHFYTFL